MDAKLMFRIGLVLIVLVATSCQENSSTGRATYQPSYEIGAILPLTGQAAFYGESAQRGIEIARGEMQQKFPDISFKVHYADSQYLPKEGVNAFQQLSSANDLDAVITGASQVSLAVKQLAHEKGLLQMAIFSSADAYSSPDDLSVRISTKNKIEAGFIADIFYQRKVGKVSIIYLNNEFGVGFKDELKHILSEKYPGIMVVSEEAIELQQTDFRTLLRKMSQKNPDMVFMVGVAKLYAPLLKQAEEMNLSFSFVATRSAEDPVLIEIAGDAAEGLLYPYPFDAESNRKGARTFVVNYLQEYHEIPDAYAAEGYEGFRLVADALASCGRNEGCIRKFFSTASNFDSVYGNLQFDEWGDVEYSFFLKTIRKGSFIKYKE